MKKLSKNKMISYSGGAKCIYHGIGIVAIAGLGPLAAYWAYKNGRSFSECLYNGH